MNDQEFKTCDDNLAKMAELFASMQEKWRLYAIDREEARYDDFLKTVDAFYYYMLRISR
jgi:hypothetical protein